MFLIGKSSINRKYDTITYFNILGAESSPYDLAWLKHRRSSGDFAKHGGFAQVQGARIFRPAGLAVAQNWWLE